jgi:hypothetical protein
MFCQACRRPLTNETSQKYRLGPVCLRKAVKAGTAPIEALTELTAEQRGKKRIVTKQAEQLKRTCTKTPDLFEQLRAAALDDLSKAVSVCESVGIKVNWSIEQ